MSLVLASNQSPRITGLYLDQKNRVGDPAPGVSVSTAQASGSIVQPYTGMVGGKLTLTEAEAKTLSDPTTITLHGGIYMYVHFILGSTNSNNPGQLVFWYNEQRYEVTPDPQAGYIAGVTLNQVTKNNYDFIQIAGVAPVLFGALTGPGTIGNSVIQVPGNNIADIPLAATAVTWGNLPEFIGVVQGITAVASQINSVRLNIINGWVY